MPVQNKPIIHGRDHELDGADPIRGLLPQAGGDYEARVLAIPDLRGYWRLGEAEGVYHDISGHDLDDPADLTLNANGVSMTRDDEGALPAQIDDGAATFNYAATSPATSGTSVADWLEDSPPYDSRFNFATQQAMSVAAWIKPAAAAGTINGGIVSSWNTITGSPNHYAGWVLYMAYPSQEILYARGGTDGVETITAGILDADEWHHVAATYDGTDMRLYVDGAVVDPVASPLDMYSANTGATIGHAVFSSTWPAAPSGSTYLGRFHGSIDEAAVWARALTAAEVESLADNTGGGGVGWVLTPDPDNPGGPPIWAPPGTEIEHGDGDPEENPVTSPPGPYTGTPENGSGWHYQAHFEYVVLYDSSPGRFDVPPRKWVRVPFNTVRIQRRWELEVDGDFRDAWLPDDRGLTEHAKNGTLLVTPAMAAADQTITGWFSIEYPALNPLQLPNYEGDPFESGIDNYVRAARMVSVTSGQVLRYQPEPNYRRFFEWPFTASADGDALPIRWTVDNPYPNYPNWPARPLNKPLPYPKLSAAASLANYTDAFGGQGFELNALTVDANLPAGHALALQAWQDSPWLLRFGTDKYPPYTPFAYQQEWRKRPALVLRFDYDPDTVDHDTGQLL